MKRYVGTPVVVARKLKNVARIQHNFNVYEQREQFKRFQ